MQQHGRPERAGSDIILFLVAVSHTHIRPNYLRVGANLAYVMTGRLLSNLQMILDVIRSKIALQSRALESSVLANAFLQFITLVYRRRFSSRALQHGSRTKSWSGLFLLGLRDLRICGCDGDLTKEMSKKSVDDDIMKDARPNSEEMHSQSWFDVKTSGGTSLSRLWLIIARKPLLNLMQSALILVLLVKLQYPRNHPHIMTPDTSRYGVGIGSELRATIAW
ncbi:hypothetical protein MRB53_041228 [Persea americana]|nr:hypothetical protein MRB53_041228 [Persea americana]